jgi:hypothetical protein
LLLELLLDLPVQLLRGLLVGLLPVLETADAHKCGNRENRPENEREYHES